MDTYEVGHAGACRERVYVILAHKTRTSVLHNPNSLYEAIVAKIQKYAVTTPSDYFVADSLEIQMVANDLANTRSKTLRTAPKQKLRYRCFQFSKLLVGFPQCLTNEIHRHQFKRVVTSSRFPRQGTHCQTSAGF